MVDEAKFWWGVWGVLFVTAAVITVYQYRRKR
jgi:hypothetical protein